MVPDRFLALFDENELELLICGVRDYKLSELVIDYSKNKIVDCESSENVTVAVLVWLSSLLTTRYPAKTSKHLDIMTRYPPLFFGYPTKMAGNRVIFAPITRHFGRISRVRLTKQDLSDSKTVLDPTYCSFVNHLIIIKLFY